MLFNPWTFLFELINFVVLVYILRRILYRPLQDAIEHRREAISLESAEASKAREQARALQKQLEERLATLEQERQDMVHRAREQAEAERKLILDSAEVTLKTRRDEVEQQIDRDRAEALQTLRGELVQSAIELAQRFLAEASGTSLQRQLAGRLVEELERIPEGDRSRLRTEWGDDDSAILETASELDGETLHALAGALEALAGRAVRLTVQTQPSLLGGVRLLLGGHVWDSSLSSGLREGDAAQASRVGSVA